MLLCIFVVSIQYELPAFTYLPFQFHQVVGNISLLLFMKGLSGGELPVQYHSHIEGILPVDFPWDCTSFDVLASLFLRPSPDLPSGLLVFFVTTPYQIKLDLSIRFLKFYLIFSIIVVYTANILIIQYPQPSCWGYSLLLY